MVCSETMEFLALLSGVAGYPGLLRVGPLDIMGC
jgi:hypothetical protein